MIDELTPEKNDYIEDKIEEELKEEELEILH